MTRTIAENFIKALGHLESNNDPEPLVALFDADSEAGNATASESYHGTEQIREFWRRYQDNFRRIRSTFRNQITAENRAALEWESQGQSKSGKPVKYEGVSILECGDGKIIRFYAYFDSGRLSQQLVDDSYVR